jgi:uncharacterized protein (DUF1778 family)
MNYGLAYRQAYEMQKVLYEATLAGGTEPKDKAACARAWDVLADRRRIIRGQGAPKPVVALNDKPKGKAKPDPAKFVEPA